MEPVPLGPGSSSWRTAGAGRSRGSDIVLTSLVNGDVQVQVFFGSEGSDFYPEKVEGMKNYRSKCLLTDSV